MFRHRKSIYWQQVLNSKATNSSVEKIFRSVFFFSCFSFFFPQKWTPRKFYTWVTVWLSYWQMSHKKWKIASLECALDIFGLFSSSPLFPLSSITLHSCAFSPLLIVSSFLLSPLSSLTPPLIFYLSIHLPLLLPCLPTSFYASSSPPSLTFSSPFLSPHPSSFLLSLSVKRLLQ